MKRYIFAVISWPLTALFILFIDAIIRRQSARFHEPRSDFSIAAGRGLFEIFGSHLIWLLPLATVLPMAVILWKKSRKTALISPLIFFVLGVFAMPFVLMFYACIAAKACF